MKIYFILKSLKGIVTPLNRDFQSTFSLLLLDGSTKHQHSLVIVVLDLLFGFKNTVDSKVKVTHTQGIFMKYEPASK